MRLCFRDDLLVGMEMTLREVDRDVWDRVRGASVYDSDGEEYGEVFSEDSEGYIYRVAFSDLDGEFYLVVQNSEGHASMSLCEVMPEEVE